MPAIARSGDEVLSPDGSGNNCAFPLITFVGTTEGVEVNDKNVRVNGQLVPIKGNSVTEHPKTGCILESPGLSTYSLTVRIGFKGIGRIGDKYSNNIIIEGSSNVFAGN